MHCCLNYVAEELDNIYRCKHDSNKFNDGLAPQIVFVNEIKMK